MSIKFQHNNKIIVTQETYEYVKGYRQELLKSCSKLLNDLCIKYVISHGNLIEYSRQTPIYHDDDLDIRIDVNDTNKFEKVNTMNMEVIEGKCIFNDYNLVLDKRCINLDKFKVNGVQGKLIEFNKHLPFKMNIHVDIVPNITDTEPIERYNSYKKCKYFEKFWIDYDIDYTNLREIVYMNTHTYAPSLNDTKKVLEKQYGTNYIIPNLSYKLDFNPNNV
tara:strand:- start:67 stop:726 length:660 start_codon:yes stop_codon:yes gene_type:complete